MRHKVLVYGDAYAIIFLDSLRKRIRHLNFAVLSVNRKRRLFDSLFVVCIL